MRARPVSLLVAVAFVAGLVVGGAAVLWTQPTDRAIDPAAPPYTVSTATGCIDAPGGWAVTTPTDEGQTAVVNLTVEHGPGETVETALAYEGDGRYRFDVTTVTGEKSGAPDCRTGSTVVLWGAFPDTFASVTVAVDGETVGTVRRASTEPSYQPLPGA